MPEAIKAALTTELAISNQSSAIIEAPQELQYMPPGTHRINASRGGKPVSLDITVNSSTAETLNKFLQEQLTKATEGNDDRPFFDFNHEDREAAAWPTEFYWAGDDPLAGGVRAKVEWSGAGKKAVTEKTFRRFSPTFVPDEAGHVIGSETNMGGLVNRAAFKTIAPLFAKSETLEVNAPSLPPLELDPTIIQAIESRLDRTLELVQANWSDESRAASERARRAMGWPGLSQTWGDGRGGAGPSRKTEGDTPAPGKDSDPEFQEEERRSEEEYRDYQRERAEEDARSEDAPSRTFDEIASDPEALRQLSDLDLIEFQEFTTGQTRERFREEVRRRQTQVPPRAQ